ncbi:hypothetical protein F441_13629 [Phytophthora nicotianae CJ01A1]|uniref:Uncharacterized protein n=1 Tax=Phytophthora nicotianae CJ01A1 TaxID=1317063 RepID=W2WL06_PHYNI|nr:hypothetical protein F441_13629 [Phytophthora nicotianae CJ01A1]
MMQLKLNKHLVDSTKTEAAWNQWLVSSRGKTVKLLIFKYGMAITKAKDLDNFEATCIRPRETDRAGATAEVSLREVANELEAHWGVPVSSHDRNVETVGKPYNPKSKPFELEGKTFAAPTSSHRSVVTGFGYASGTKDGKSYSISSYGSGLCGWVDGCL